MQDQNVSKLHLVKFAVGCACFAVDALSKSWARSALAASGEAPFISGLVRFNLVTNTGAAFNLGSGHALIMTAVATIVTLLLIFWVFSEERRAVNGRFFVNIGAGFLIGGALGNLADRFIRGRVTDFIELEFIRFPVFNCADVFIDIGVILLMFNAWRNKRSSRNNGNGAAAVVKDTEQIVDSN